MNHRVGPEAENKRDFRVPTRLALFVFFAMLIALRPPFLWSEGRFQDEEATVFLAFAWHFPEEALLRSFAGYLNIAANTSTLVLAQLIKSGTIDLANAPYFTMIAGLSFQLIPILLVLTADAPWLRSGSHRILAALLIAIAPGSEEVTANVIHIQFHLALAVAIILAVDAPRRRIVEILYSGPLFVAPLCGPAAILLTPLFALRFLLEREKSRLFQCLALGAGSLLQIIFFYSESPIRSTQPDISTALAGGLLRLILLPLFGGGLSTQAGEAIIASQAHGATATIALALIFLSILSAIAVRIMLKRSSATWLLAAGLAIALPSFSFGLATTNANFVLLPNAGPRYQFIPLAMLSMALLAGVTEATGRARVALVSCLAMAITTSTLAYRRPILLGVERPSWRAEVNHWRLDNSHALRVWGSNRALVLDGEPQRCEARASAPAPSYCESRWTEEFAKQSASDAR